MSEKIKTSTARPGVVAKYAHLKLDGHFVRVHLYDDSQLRVYTSRPTDITTKLPSRILEPLTTLPDGKYLGELWVPGKPAAYVKTAIKNDDSRLTLTFFAVEEFTADVDHIAWWGRDLEYAGLLDVAALFAERRLQFAPFETLGDVPRTIDESELQFLRARARQIGPDAEGWVLKIGNLHGWTKLKLEETIDLVVVGATEGKGKHAWGLGSLEGGVYCPDLRSVASVGGLTDEERADVTADWDEDPNSVIGRVMEVKYQRVDARGRLRHPRFLRWRDDKDAAECVASQDPYLEERLR